MTPQGQTPDLFDFGGVQTDPQAGRRVTPPAVHLPPPRVTVRRAPKAGRALAERGAQLAADKADEDTGGRFRAAALRHFVTFAMNARSSVGVAEARLASVGIVPAVANARAWGQVPKMAERDGYVTFAGHGASTDPKSHSTPRGLWLWTGKTWAGA